MDENTANPGPTFKFKDVGVYDLGDGLTLADYIKVGSNVRIQAKVQSYNSDTGLFELDPDVYKRQPGACALKCGPGTRHDCCSIVRERAFLSGRRLLVHGQAARKIIHP